MVAPSPPRLSPGYQFTTMIFDLFFAFSELYAVSSGSCHHKQRKEHKEEHYHQYRIDDAVAGSNTDST